ncbi:unnamed protein product [Vitrella brassicaformis CCMP3155]|uniref:Cyclic nucleotide-binding domain-containing protein n=1 Tax=Vitrella brassicaformis (strain CCMP3155) TaxID=1169540 RepID=A0A0G4GY59_VITBC|nr:unnamed protein product [Vitrella brassicaformis CCMP3155]|eukprot:CEM36017.1 unnamed protein product [Vitrella brassicaformis CCMP3155]
MRSGSGLDAHEEDLEGRGSTHMDNMPENFKRVRRTGVSAEAVTKERMAKWKKPVYPKAEADKAKIRSVINTKLQVLFGHLDDEAREAVIDAMFRKEVKKGEMLIQQGQEGDNFYVVDKGMFDILVARGNNPPKKVTEVSISAGTQLLLVPRLVSWR